MVTQATDKQVAYLLSLWEAIAHPAHEVEAVRNGTLTLGRREASDLIEEAKTRKTLTRRATAAPAVTQGLYITGDAQSAKVHKVVLSARGNLYAKTLTPGGGRGRWEYAPGIVNTLTPEDALTPAKAAEYGKTQREGWDGSILVYCACCGAELDNEESRDRGIGPVCFRKYF
jgi:hypothetical protein